MTGLELFVRTETTEMPSALRERVLGMERKYHLIRVAHSHHPGEPLGRVVVSPEGGYVQKLYYTGVGVIKRWQVRRYLVREIPEAIRTEKSIETYVGPR